MNKKYNLLSIVLIVAFPFCSYASNPFDFMVKTQLKSYRNAVEIYWALCAKVGKSYTVKLLDYNEFLHTQEQIKNHLIEIELVNRDILKNCSLNTFNFQSYLFGNEKDTNYLFHSSQTRFYAINKILKDASDVILKNYILGLKLNLALAKMKQNRDYYAEESMSKAIEETKPFSIDTITSAWGNHEMLLFNYFSVINNLANELYNQIYSLGANQKLGELKFDNLEIYGNSNNWVVKQGEYFIGEFYLGAFSSIMTNTMFVNGLQISELDGKSILKKKYNRIGVNRLDVKSNTPMFGGENLVNQANYKVIVLDSAVNIYNLNRNYVSKIQDNLLTFHCPFCNSDSLQLISMQENVEIYKLNDTKYKVNLKNCSENKITIKLFETVNNKKLFRASKVFEVIE